MRLWRAGREEVQLQVVEEGAENIRFSFAAYSYDFPTHFGKTSQSMHLSQSHHFPLMPCRVPLLFPFSCISCSRP